MNVFAKLLEPLHRNTMACLQAVCLRCQSLPEIEAWARAGPMEPHLKRLADLGLVTFEDSSWLPTWSGRGVHNWHQQVLFAESFGDTELPEPQLGENGDQVVPVCAQYRSLYCSPGYCWCGHLRSQHAARRPPSRVNSSGSRIASPYQRLAKPRPSTGIKSTRIPSTIQRQMTPSPRHSVQPSSLS